MEEKNTPGAMRAAKQLSGQGLIMYAPEVNLETIALIIDKETGAPELLAALKSIKNHDGRIPPTIWKMRNDAIAKAEGEPRNQARK